MKFQMAKGSLFAVLLRSPWWASMAVAAAIALAAAALLPPDFKVVGAVSALPFVVIGVLAGYRQWRMPSAARVAQTVSAVGRMSWGEFAPLLERAFQRDGYTVRAGRAAPVDFELERQGRRLLVSARRWKSARTGLEALRALQAAREADDGADALYVGLGELTETARPYAAAHGIAVWQSAELAQALRGLPLAPTTAR